MKEDKGPLVRVDIKEAGSCSSEAGDLPRVRSKTTDVGGVSNRRLQINRTSK